MDMHRALLAIVLSILIMLGYQYFFIAPTLQQRAQLQQHEQLPAGQSASGEPEKAAPGGGHSAQTLAPAAAAALPQSLPLVKEARDITIDTPLYTAVLTEQGGGCKSFLLKKYRREKANDSGLMQLVQTSHPLELPLLFTLDNGVAASLPLYHAEYEHLTLSATDQRTSLVMTAELAGNIQISRTLVFDPASYLVEQSYRVTNGGDVPYQLSPALSLTNQPFSAANSASQYMFSGAVAYVGNELSEVKTAELAKESRRLTGQVSWAGYENTYFLCAVLPKMAGESTVSMTAAGEKITTVVASAPLVLNPHEMREFSYQTYCGPKKLEFLKAADGNLASAVNFGWFDILAKPMLSLLNFFYKFFGNYGIAIILLTVLIKLIFWPIAQKGMKSMKNMQKVQPKMAKLREKFKDDPQKLNQEMMTLYRTYKINPLGGCLPMFLQIPFFFALYKVLLLSIELRHAPFMLWINDLSAPDRLGIGFDLPLLHGIPVLTILMGISMYFQQKMTPTTGDPTQAKIMQMVPIVFTVMFVNFAAGLVLYWFVSNLLSMLQQYLVNRQFKA